MNPIATVALVGTGLWLVNKAVKTSVVNRVNFLIDAVRPSYEGLNPVLTFDIKAQNPTNDTFTIKSLTGNVSVNGQYAGNISSFQETIITANSESRLTLKAKMSAGGLSEQIVNLIQGRVPSQVLIRIQGTANVDTLLFPVDLTYKIV